MKGLKSCDAETLTEAFFSSSSFSFSLFFFRGFGGGQKIHGASQRNKKKKHKKDTETGWVAAGSARCGTDSNSGDLRSVDLGNKQNMFKETSFW